MKTNPFVFLYSPAPKPLTRLTDIETEEVSLVDKAANKRRFAVIKRDSENAMNKAVNTEQFLEGLNAGLDKLIALTEVVKAKVEKAEDATAVEAVDWKSSMDALMGWAAGQMASHFSGDDPAQPKTETNMDAEVAAQTTGTASPAGDATAGATANANDSVGKETAEQMVTGTASPTGDVASGAAAVATETIRNETEEQMVAGTGSVGDAGKPQETNSAGSVINKAKDFADAVLGLASTEVTEEALNKAIGLTEGLFFSGGFSVDAYDIEALAAVVNAICEQMTNPDEIEKSADRLVSEVAKKAVTISKRISKADYKLTAADSKEMRVATELLKAAAAGMKSKKKPAKDGKEASNAGSLGKDNDKPATKMKKDENTFTAEDIAKIVNDAVASAVAKAIEPIAKKNEALTTAVVEVTKEKDQIVKDYNAAMSTTQTRVSSSETATSTAVESSVIHVNSVGVADYNAKGE